jgi:asparagine synthetase B (glutamine-hydrolysing)
VPSPLPIGEPGADSTSSALLQPTLALEEGYGALLDGVIYNSAELQEELGLASGPKDTPAALVLAVYKRYGPAFLGKLRGVFALLVWDEPKALLLAARDPLGVYPLFYAEARPGLLFSPSIETLLAEPSVSRALNRPALADHLCHRWTRPAETYYAAVRRVLPGHYLRVRQGQGETVRYWQVLPDGPISWVTEAEVGEFDTLLDRAVARAQSPGPTGLWLSGGLDSVTVATVASDQTARTGQPLPLALSMVLPDPECNEAPLQRAIAARLGLAQQIMDVGTALAGADLLPTALRMSAGWPVPLANMFLPALETITSRGRAAGCRVILTGGGGDETLGVGPMYAADLLRRGDLRSLYRLTSATLRSAPRSRAALLRYLLWTEGARRLLTAAGSQALRQIVPPLYARRRRRRVLYQTPAWIAPDPQLRREIDERVVESITARVTKEFYLHAARTELDDPYIGMEMEELFTFGGRLDVTIRQPFWDPDLLAFLYRTPPELLNRGGRSKGLIREKLARRFPDLGFESQRKVDATRFYRRTILEQGRAAWNAIGGPRSLVQLDLVDVAGLDSVLEPILSGAQNTGSHRFWDTIRLEAWLRPRVI